MTTSAQLSGRLNPAVAGMAAYTLRRTDVNDLLDKRKNDLEGRVLVEARLGDPVVFGLGQPRRYLETLSHVVGMEASHRYTNALGLPELRELLGSCNPEAPEHIHGIHPDNVFIGPGISSVARAFFTTLIRNRNGDEVLTPQWSYIIYLSEAMLSGANAVTVRLKSDGQIDLQHLESRITERTKAVFVTTVGNPLGITVDSKKFLEIVRIVNEKERQYNHAIYLVADTIYEAYRNGPRLDPIELSRKAERIGPTVEFYSISKLLSAPGDRIGWMKLYHSGESFKEEVSEFLEMMSRLAQPTLCQVQTAPQIALYKYYLELMDSSVARTEFNQFADKRRAEVRRRLHSFVDGIASIDGVVFPPYCYKHGKADGELTPNRAINYDAFTSFYVLWGISTEFRKRGEFSLAREVAEFLIDHPNHPVLLGTPGDNFLATELRGAKQEFMRIVSLSEDVGKAVDAVRAFAESKKG